MNIQCAVPLCPFKSSRLFKSPTDPDALELWMRILNIPSELFHVCVEHFEEKFIKVEKKLTSDAVPTLFLNDITVRRSERCKICTKSFIRSTLKVGLEPRCKFDHRFMEIYKSVMDSEIVHGVACLECFNSIMSFYNFRTRIQYIHGLQNEKTKPKSIGTFKIPPMKVMTKKPVLVVRKKEPEVKEEPTEELSSIVEFEEEKIIKQEPLDEEVITNDGGNFIIKEVTSIPPKDVIKVSQDQLKLIKQFTIRSKILHDKTTFPCSICRVLFVSKDFLAEHMRQKHNFVCSICNFKFQHVKNLISHQTEVHGSILEKSREKSFECQICKASFASKAAREKHMIDAHRIMISGSNVYRFVKHPIGNRIVKLRGPEIVSPNFFTKLPPSEPLTEDPDGIPCLDCGLLFLPDKLLKHRTESHEYHSMTTVFTCDLCGNKFQGKHVLIQHMSLVHMYKKNIKCDFCEARFETNTEKFMHKNQKHNFNGTRFTCHFCMMMFGDKQHMMLHRKCHHKEEEMKIGSTRATRCRKFEAFEPKGKTYVFQKGKK